MDRIEVDQGMNKTIGEKILEATCDLIKILEGRIVENTGVTSQIPGVSVCQHCSIMFLFMMWTSSSHFSLNS